MHAELRDQPMPKHRLPKFGNAFFDVGLDLACGARIAPIDKFENSFAIGKRAGGV